MSIELNQHICGDWWDGLGPISYKINGVPVDITGTTIKMHMKKDRKPNSPIVLKWSTTENTIEIVDGPGGIFNIKGRIIDVPQGTYISDIEIISVDGKPRTIIPEIIWNFVADVTR